MPNIPTFLDFVAGTKVHKITSPRELLNEFVRQTYILGEMVRAAENENIRLVRTGQSVKDTIQLRQAGSFRFYSPHSTQTPPDVDITKDINLGWRFALSSYSFADEIVDLNEGDMEDVYVDQKNKYEQGAHTDMVEGTEDALWAVPVYASMEQGTGEDPAFYSIPAWLNEGTNGVFPATGWQAAGLKGTINANTETRWRPQRTTYDHTSPTDNGDGILPAFDSMWRKVHFKSPKPGQRWWEDDAARVMQIITNGDGQDLYKKVLRANNDQFRPNASDAAHNEPVYGALPVVYIETLDRAKIGMTSATVASGAAWASGRPRYLWLNFKWMFPIFHSKHIEEPVGPKDIAGMPFSHAMYFRTWMVLFARSLQRLGITYPAAFDA